MKRVCHPPQRGYNLAEGPQARLAGSPLQIGDVDFMDARMLGKVDLPPAFGPAQFSDALSSRRADVLCHVPMFGLVDALYLAHTLFGGKDRTKMRIGLAAFALCLFVSPLALGQAALTEITNSDVISMTKAGIGEQTIILAIQRGPDKFDTSPRALIALKHAGVPDRVLNAILAVPGETNSKAKSSQFQPSSQTTQQSNSEQNAHRTIPTNESRNVCASQPGETSVASTVRTTCCEKGFGSSCSNLAYFYETGAQGLPKDPSVANLLADSSTKRNGVI